MKIEEAVESENKEEEAEKVGNNGLNDSHHSRMEELPAFQDALYLGNPVIGEINNEESINSAIGLESIVQDSQSPLNEECLKSAKNSCQLHLTEAQAGENQEQDKDGGFVDNIPEQCDSNCSIRASQVRGINLLVDLNPSAVRRNIRSQ